MQDLEKERLRAERAGDWCLRRRGVPETLVRLIAATYHEEKAAVWTAFGKTEDFDIKVRFHQRSALSPLLFIAKNYKDENYRRKTIAMMVALADRDGEE